MMIPGASCGHPELSNLLQARSICKAFGDVRVLQAVNLELRGGEVHALVGENGAGKSTFMNILAGVLQPDAGEIVFLGQSTRGFADARAAQQRGIAMVFQERSLFAPLTVAENIFAGRQPVRGLGQIDRRRLRDGAAALLAQVAPEVSPTARVEQLSPAQQQMVEVAKALSLQARVIIFDEPTAALTETETGKLFRVIRGLRSRGVGIIYISHRLDEVFGLADRVTVLKDGVGQGTWSVGDITPGELVRRMVGRDVMPVSTGQPGSEGAVLLDVRDLSDSKGGRGASALLCHIHLQARAGEIVGLA